MAQKSSHGTGLAEIDVNFIFRRTRRGDGGMGAVWGKCRRCFSYRNALEIENLYPKEEVGIVGGEPVRAPPQQRPQPPSQFSANIPGVKQYVVNASCSIFPRFSTLRFFYFPEVEIVAEGQHLGGFGRNKIENGCLPAEHSQI